MSATPAPAKRHSIDETQSPAARNVHNENQIDARFGGLPSLV